MDTLLKNRWNEVLKLIQIYGWHPAEKEIQRRIDALALTDSNQNDSEAYILVLSTLQQKFGQLDSSANLLRRLVLSKNKQVAADATVRLGKVLSQKGDFAAANNMLLGLYPLQSGRYFNTQPDGVSGSVLWRLGFLNGIIGNSQQSEYWFNRHQFYSTNHGSQIANNSVFRNVVRISNGDFDLINAISLNEIGIHYYLKDTITVQSVKYINVSKSVVVPLLLNGIIFLWFRDYYSAVLQIMLCRRLIQIEGLSYDSEGISETLQSLKISPISETRLLGHVFSSDENTFLNWLKEIVNNEKILSFLIGERESIIKEYIATRDYSLLSIRNSTTYRMYSIPKNIKVSKMTNKNKVFLIHGHDELNLFRLKEYLSKDLELQPVVLKDNPSRGLTIIEKFEQLASDCYYAIAIFTKDDVIENKGESYLQARPNVIFELGWFYGKLSRSNVLILFQEGVKVPSDLDGIVRIQFSDNILEKSHEIKKEIESI